jgi:hypothetical protein
MGVSTRLAALPAAQPKDDREGLPLPDVLTLSSDTKKGNPIQLPSAMLRPDDARSKTTLTRSDAQHTHPESAGRMWVVLPALLPWF